MSFDCFGTIIDWERGILEQLGPWVTKAALTAKNDALLAAFARHESAAEAERPFLPYRSVLQRVISGIAGDFNTAVSAADAESFSATVGRWPPFADSRAALAYLKQHFTLIVVSNVDRQSFETTQEILDHPFSVVITADDVESYKPALPHFERALETIAARGIARSELLHVAQSLYHDIAPANALGLKTCWIDRRHGLGGGATPGGSAQPDLVLPDLASLVARHAAEQRPAG